MRLDLRLVLALVAAIPNLLWRFLHRVIEPPLSGDPKALNP